MLIFTWHLCLARIASLKAPPRALSPVHIHPPPLSGIGWLAMGLGKAVTAAIIAISSNCFALEFDKLAF